MKLVVDSSIAVKWALVEQHTVEARQLRDDFNRGIHELIAPDILPVEVTHAITKAQRNNRITAKEGAELLTQLLISLPVLYGSLRLLPRAYEISAAARIGIYDCLYVALAEQNQCQVVTVDTRLMNRLPGYPILHLSSLP